MEYSIIIPTHRENEVLNNCLKWLNDFGHINKVLVVNDNDKDYKLKMSFNCNVINTKSEAWWSGSINLGIKNAIKNNCNFVILLNSDNWGNDDIITKLAKRTKENLNFIHAASVANQNGIVRCTTGIVNIEDYSVNMFNHNKHISELTNNTYFGNYNGGMAVSIPINVLDKIGLLDEKLPLSADREFFYRAFTFGIPVCGYEDLLIFTDDSHKAIDRGKMSKYKIIRKMSAINNFRSPIYYKTIFYFYKKFTKRPIILTILAIFNYLSFWRK